MLPPGVAILPPGLDPLFRACASAGGRALFVGGYVRDLLLGHPNKDVDIEVHHLDVDVLRALLRRLGHVNEVGRSFGVLKLRLADRTVVGDHEIDVSLPRRDSREGPGHRGIRATADPHLGVTESARRRDLTINAIAYDPLTDRFEDPFNGRADLEAGLLRAVDDETFGEDPLRALRVAQFAARFNFRIDPALERLCAAMPLHELPAERIRGEVEKLLLRAPRPSIGWDFAWRSGAWGKVLPEWGRCPEEVDRCAAMPVDDPVRRLALLLAAACSGLDPAATARVLDRLWIHRVEGYPVRRTVLGLVDRRTAAEGPVDDSACRRLGEGGEVELLAALVDRPDLAARAERLGVARSPLPPLLGGRHLTALGVEVGPEMGRVLADLRSAQLDGIVSSAEDARTWVRRRMEAPRGT